VTDGVRGGSAGGRGQVERVVLLGFMGAGKTTVGAMLARRLGWRFVDLDHLVEQRAGRSVPDIFAQDGEARFRQLEREATDEVAAWKDVVIAPGGGWVTTAGNFERFGDGTLTVWLQVSAEAALERASTAGGPFRPLLAVSDPSATAARLLREREALYARANLHLPTLDRTPDQVVRQIESYVRMRDTSPLRSELQC
jgi:shikimate kinase